MLQSPLPFQVSIAVPPPSLSLEHSPSWDMSLGLSAFWEGIEGERRWPSCPLGFRVLRMAHIWPCPGAAVCRVCEGMRECWEVLSAHLSAQEEGQRGGPCRAGPTHCPISPSVERGQPRSLMTILTLLQPSGSCCCVTAVTATTSTLQGQPRACPSPGAPSHSL